MTRVPCTLLAAGRHLHRRGAAAVQKLHARVLIPYPTCLRRTTCVCVRLCVRLCVRVCVAAWGVQVCTLGNKLFQWNNEQPACSIFVECTAPRCSNVVSSDNTGPNKGPASDRQPQHARCRRQQCQRAASSIPVGTPRPAGSAERMPPGPVASAAMS